jgi:TRAP-type mannitol/chloroaromatic compound transport system substrate-binding protein
MSAMSRRERRRFLTQAAAAGAALASGAVAPALAQSRQQWTMVTAWPKEVPLFPAAAERLARRIGELSQGQLTVRVLHGGELVPASQTFDSVAGGQAELGYDLAANQTGKHRAFAFFSSVPFGFTAPEMTAWIAYGGGQALWDELCAPHGVSPFLCGNAGTQYFGWFKRELRTPEDLRGLRMRILGLGAEVLRRLGGTPAAVPGAECVAALRSGELDGAEWYAPDQDLALGLHEAAKLYYGPAFHRPGLAIALVVNRKAQEALSPGLRRVLAAAAAAENGELYAEATQRSATALATLVSAHRVEPRRVPNELMVALGNASGAVLAEERERADQLGKRVFESFLRMRRLAIPFARQGELAFDQARTLAFKFID